MLSPAAFSASYPIALFPVSLQTKFVENDAAFRAANPARAQFELWVRIYPDYIGVSTHEEQLTAAERTAGQAYWTDAPDAEAKTMHSLAQWRVLVNTYGVARSLWILEQTTPTNQAARETGLAAGTAVAPSFATLAEAASSWTRAAHSLVMPDRFSVLLYRQATAAEVTDPLLTEQLLPLLPNAQYAPESVPDPTTEFLVEAKRVEGAAIGADPLPVGPYFSEDTSTSLTGLDDTIAWLVDFDKAVEAGMAVVIPFADQAEFTQTYKRLLVVGIRASGSPTTGQDTLETVLRDHFYTDGLAIVPQGTPTNNTDAEGSGYSSGDDGEAEASFSRLTAGSFATTLPGSNTPWQDGHYLAAAFGITPEIWRLVPQADGRDVAEAKTMNRALWPATYGYFLAEMLDPLFSEAAIAWTRTFFEDYVLGRGLLPAFRAGNQPYGVLPATRYSTWVPASSSTTYAQTLTTILQQLDVTWTERLQGTGTYATQTGGVPFSPEPPATRNFLSTLGLEAASSGYYSRYLLGPHLTGTLDYHATTSAGTTTSIWKSSPGNSSTPLARPGRLGGTTSGAVADPLYTAFKAAFDPDNHLALPAKGPKIFAQTFQEGYRQLAQAYRDEAAPKEGVLGAIIERLPLSETRALAPIAGTQVNYIQWLATASFDTIRRLDFSALKPATGYEKPNSLLFWLLRHAVLLQYWEAGARVLNLPATDRREKELFNILAEGETARWQHLYTAVSGQPLHTVLRAGSGTQSSELISYLQQVQALADLPTARLERLLAEHLDVGSYRLDAWKTAQVAQRLLTQRQTSSLAHGCYLGAYGWLENVRQQDQSLDQDDAGGLLDPDNLGYIHAPSINHATASAIVRQGYKSRQLTADSASEEGNRMALNLSSERVRKALALVDGIRSGQPLSSLLGHDFEAGLHRYTATVGTPALPYAAWIRHFRREFPYTLSQELLDQVEPDAELARTQGEEYVVDGLALVYASQDEDYPYGVADLPEEEEEPDFAAAVTAEVAALRDTLDALGDLTVGESIYQSVLGNREQASALLDSVAQGKFPVEPQFVHPPRSSTALTHRVLAQLPLSAPTELAAWDSALTPRAAAEPALNWWLATFLQNVPALEIAYTLSWSSSLVKHISIAELGLQPVDLIALLADNPFQEGSPFDAYARAAIAAQSSSVRTSAGYRGVLDVQIEYTNVAALRKILPLIHQLQQVLAGSRAATLADMTPASRLLPGEAYSDSTTVNTAELRARIEDTVTDLESVLDILQQSVSFFDSVFSLKNWLKNYRAALRKLLLYGITESHTPLRVAEQIIDTSSTSTIPEEVIIAILRLEATSLRQAAAPVRAEVERRLAEAAPWMDEETEPVTTVMTKAAEALFGPGFRLTWQFTLPDEAPNDYASFYQQAVAASSTTALLRHHADNPTLLTEWLQGLSRVREPMDHLDKALMLGELLGTAASMELTPVQLSAQPDFTTDYWLGAEYPETYTPPGDALSLVQLLPADYAAQQDFQQALWLDEWSELIPHRTETTAVAFHFDQPNTQAPQTVLLAVSPQTSGNWTTEDLVGTLNETLDMAKKRTVEPDSLAYTHLGMLLPAVVAPVAQQAATITLDFRKVNQSARYREDTLDEAE